MTLSAQLESLLFVSPKPLALKVLAGLVEADEKTVSQALETLADEYRQTGRGFTIINQNHQYQLVTAGDNAALVKKLLRIESGGELTPASLEALTVIAYRGPITKTELERLRGVNCSLIIRNLLLRGLIEEKEDRRQAESLYTVTLEFVKYLGLPSLDALPDYDKLHRHETITQTLERTLVEI
jgi:segregation and condensation protein B